MAYKCLLDYAAIGVIFAIRNLFFCLSVSFTKNLLAPGWLGLFLYLSFNILHHFSPFQSINSRF